MLDVILPLILLAGLVYLLQRLAQFGASRMSPKTLQTHRLSQLPPDAEDNWHIERRGFTLSIWTEMMNAVPGQVLGRRGVRGIKVLQRMYDVGSTVGLAGGVVGMGGALWAMLAVWREVWVEAEVHARFKAPEAVKRAVEAVAAVAPRLGGGGIHPLLPGVTVPWSHLPTLVLALLLNQLMHELGHAMSAALDDVQMSRLSLNLHVLLPSATVSFPSSVDSLPIRAKLRLASSGPLHNLLIAGLLWLVASSGLNRIFWRDMTYEGVVVQSVKPLSPLYGHLHPGDVVTHLDDVFLGDDREIWSPYLAGTDIGDDGRGWCVDRSVYLGLAPAPCSAASGSVTFEPVDSAEQRDSRCLATHPILHIPSSQCPCPSSRWICVHPSHAEEILRIRLKDVKGVEKGAEGVVVLFAGDRREVLDGVTVGTRGARFFGPLVRWYTLFLEYMSTIALSLFILNLIPLPHTDGSAILRQLLVLYPKHPSAASPSLPSDTRSLQATLSNGPSNPPRSAPSINISRQYELNSDDEDAYDAEGGGKGAGTGRKEDAWKRRVRRGVEGGMMGVGVAWAVGWVFLALLRSS